MGRLTLTCLMLSLLSVSTLAVGLIPQIPTRNGNNDQRIPSDQKAGSLLIYNYYSSSAVASDRNNDTEIAITNAHSTQSVAIHFFFIASAGSIADAFVCLLANQTASFRTSQVDPGTTGYIVAIAVNRETGCPISFNHLIGRETVKLPGGYVADLGAIGVAALYQGIISSCHDKTATINIRLDGLQYNALPRTLAASSLRSAVDGNTNLLIVNALGGSLAVGASTIGNLTGTVFNDETRSADFAIRCDSQFQGSLSDEKAFPFSNTGASFTALVLAGRTGWMKMTSSRGVAITGALLNFNPKAGELAGAKTGGHNLQQLDYTSTNFDVPVFPPSC